ncbi:mediator of RNA polymerase II transcription subunit 17-like [Clavelina lepadiformis]|uniref:mediator of RNA polymerase II transcription subunit 17-like n=1 Tax=Clavelina lepadiformis TaxID=159417 RepID=UPI004042BBCF
MASHQTEQNDKISIASLSENKIQEISYDGQETYFKPFTLSESLTDLANRINFLNENDNDFQEDGEEEDPKGFHQAKQWPWRDIHSHLQRALIEMNVLVDVISITQNKPTTLKDSAAESSDANRYLMYDLAQKDSEPTKPMLQLITKKKCLAGAAKILLNGYERLNKAWTETSGQISFHSELLKLRQCWRVRRVGDKIMGDLSYRTAGSNFWHSGAFEVIKRSGDDTDEDSSYGSALPSKLKSPISVEVSSDLLGYAEIFVSVINLDVHRDSLPDDVSECFSLNFHDLMRSSVLQVNQPPWHQKLVNAQNVLFCKEFFTRLTKEAIQLRCRSLYSPFVIVGDTISALVFPHTQLSVHLRYKQKPLLDKKTASSNIKSLFSFKHTLLQLLQKDHSKQLNIPTPHPTSAVLGLTPEMRHASIQPWSSMQLDTTLKRDDDSLAQAMVKMAKHYEVRRRLAKVIKMISNEYSDPDIQAHWLTLSNQYESCVRMTMASFGYEACHRTVFQATAMADKVKFLHREGKIVFVEVDESCIYKYLVTLISGHQTLTIDKLARNMGWNVLQVTPRSGIDFNSSVINRGSLVASSPSFDSYVGIVCSTTYQGTVEYDVKVKYTKSPENKSTKTSKDPELLAMQFDKYMSIGGTWQKVNWQKIYGRNFINKVETLLTCLVNYD